jgi:Fe-S cluster assembly protein SufD
VPGFTADAARGIEGPDWLRERRGVAAERFAGTALPSPDEEVWRYSRIGQLDLDRYAPATNGAAPPAEPGGGLSPLIPRPTLPPERSGLVVTSNGRIVAAEVSPPLRLGAESSDLGRVMAEPTDPFALLNEAFLREPVVVSVPRGAMVDRPLVVVHQVLGEGTAAFPRVVVRVGEAASLEVLELVVSPDVAAFVAPVVELAVERDARLGFLTVQDLGPRVWQVATQVVEVATQATLTSSAAAFGGEYARLRTDCRLVGRGASGNLVSLYFGDGHQMLDLRTFQDHAAPDTTSDLLFKGAVDDDSHSVYTGLIRVRPTARGTNAFQTNRNIKLSEGAWAESVPNLEIENNDVRCSHASTVGPIDDEQRFYLESRGVPPPVAERLIVSGFFDEVIDRLAVPSAVAPVRARVAAKLGSEAR